MLRGEFNRSAQHLLILRGKEVRHGDVTDLVHGSAEGRTVGAMEERAKCCGRALRPKPCRLALYSELRWRVVRREASGAARVVAGRFGSGPINVQYNSKEGGAATIEALAMPLQAAASGMDAENDVLFLILTSHGSRARLAVKAGRLEQTLTPSNLADMLAGTAVRHKVVVISACYSGIFIPRLANPDVLVISAADANHPSFGCRDKAKWTYFGDAFFNVALRHAKSLKDAFVVARASSRSENCASTLSRRTP